MEERENKKIIKKKWTLLVLISILSVTVSWLVLSNGVRAELNSNDKCLIIISGFDGYSSNEMEKGSSFYDYINNTLQDDNIIFLTSTSHPESDGESTLENIESAFEWLIGNSSSSNEVIIYISDHEKRLFNETYFTFNDGNISVDTIDSWIDEIDCIHTTVIINGEKSGLGGIDLQDSSRDIICSMEDDQEYDPDLFNITRSLEDPAADTNNDEVVDFIEAFWRENYLLTGTGQDPVLYQ